MSIFGRIVTATDVEQWCLDLIGKWFGTYLSEVERQHGLAAGTWQRPRGLFAVPSFDKWPEDQLPAILCVSFGIAEPPRMHGDGSYDALWQMGIGCICSASTQTLSHEMAADYGAALYDLFVQRQSLDEKAEGTRWQGFTLEEMLEFDDRRSLSAGTAVFQVEVHNVASARMGPTTPDVPLVPDTDPWDDRPAVQTVETEIEKVN